MNDGDSQCLVVPVYTLLKLYLPVRRGNLKFFLGIPSEACTIQSSPCLISTVPSSVVLDTKILLAEFPKMAKTITTPAIIKMIANLAGELVKLIVP